MRFGLLLVQLSSTILVPQLILPGLGCFEFAVYPEADFTGDAKIKYVVVDPQQGTFISPVSEITVSVSDAERCAGRSPLPVPLSILRIRIPCRFSQRQCDDIDDTLSLR